MRTDESDTRIALQPQTPVEQALVSELFEHLNRIVEADEHPTKIGSVLCYHTLDVDGYDDLDHDLWASADCGVNEHGKLDPEPGSRALVVIHGDERDLVVDDDDTDEDRWHAEDEESDDEPDDDDDCDGDGDDDEE